MENRYTLTENMLNFHSFLDQAKAHGSFHWGEMTGGLDLDSLFAFEKKRERKRERESIVLPESPRTLGGPMGRGA